MTKITTTDVKQKTRKIFEMAKKEPVKISRYGDEEFVLMNISLWEEKFSPQNNKNIEDVFIKSKSIKNSATFFRKLRDE